MRSIGHILILITLALYLQCSLASCGILPEPSDGSLLRFQSWCRDSCIPIKDSLFVQCTSKSYYTSCALTVDTDSSAFQISKCIRLVVHSDSEFEDQEDLRKVLDVLEISDSRVNMNDTVEYCLILSYWPSSVPELRYESAEEVRNLTVRNSRYVFKHTIVRASLVHTQVIER